MPDGERRLAAIMFTDIVGYTALTQSNEAQAMEVLERHNHLLRPFFPKFHGREVKVIGDSFLVEFDSALEATNCGIEIQRFLHDYNVSSRDEWKITLRIGIHLGDVVRSGNDIFGDAVNIASRLQPLAEPEGICMSDQVFGQVRNKIPQTLVKLAPQELKNIRFPVDVYKVVMPWEKENVEWVTQLDAKRIAVLPFVSMSPDPNDEYFADGVTEEIITTLSGIGALSVISRTSIVGYKGTTKKLKEIGKELEVGSILEGTFRKAGNRIRVTAQLIDVSSDKHLWAQNYDRQLDDIFAVQSEIASHISDQLKIKLVDSERQQLGKIPTKSMAAYENYLKYVHASNTSSGWKEAIKYLEEAIRQDPDFALAYALLGDFYVLFGGEVIPWKEAIENAQPLIARALELDENSSEAHVSNGNLAMQYHLDFELAEREFRRAIELNASSSRAHFSYSILHYVRGNIDEALEEGGIASRLDPLSFIVHLNLLGYLRTKRDYVSALEMWQRFSRLEPQNHLYRMIAADLSALAGNREWGEKELELALANNPVLNPWERTQLAHSLIDVGKLEDAKRQIEEIETGMKSQYYPRSRLAEVYSALGEKEKAIEMLEKDSSEIPFSFLLVYQQPEFDPIREDTRFVSLVERLNLPKKP